MSAMHPDCNRSPLSVTGICLFSITICFHNNSLNHRIIQELSKITEGIRVYSYIQPVKGNRESVDIGVLEPAMLESTVIIRPPNIE